MSPIDPDHGVYGISVAAELVGLGVQTLRQYEARGLLEPDRTAGGTRRYSPNDLDRLRRIAILLDAGLNLAGIGMVLDLEQRNLDLTEQNTLLRDAKEATMTPPDTGPTGEADEADLLDQHTPTTAEPADDESRITQPGEAAEADDADLLDQAREAADEDSDDDYPRHEMSPPGV